MSAEPRGFAWWAALVTAAAIAGATARSFGADAPERLPNTDPGAAAQGQSATTDQGWEIPIYLPPTDPGGERPQPRRSGGTRGPERRSVTLIAPRDHCGWTTKAKPTLFWYVSDVLPLPIEFVVQEIDSVTPLVLRTLPTPAAAGFQAVSLSEIGVRLQSGITYEWSIALVADRNRRSRDAAVAEAQICRKEQPPALKRRLAHLNPRFAVNIFAESSFWYDAIEEVTRSINAYPNDPGPRRQRAALLQQIGLAALVTD